MNYYASLETALALRDAGFPQPDYQFGQLWQTEDGRHDAFVGSKSWAVFIDWVREKKIPVVFLPTATDILRELGETYSLGLPFGVFRCTNFAGRSPQDWYDQNPAEACAKAWMARQNPVSLQ